MRKLVKNGLILFAVCALVTGGADVYSLASGNVVNKPFSYLGSSDKPYTLNGPEFKDDSTRTYAIASYGGAATVTVMGGKSATPPSCSKTVNLTLMKEYTIKNTVKEDKYNYAQLKVVAASGTSGKSQGYWSPDSTKNYNNVG